ncbi:MAG: hypothetical protein HQ488_01890 [Parcubacteria group bacterium]|nr:hypothetical protein [Parcubacteria group bacterium]
MTRSHVEDEEMIEVLLLLASTPAIALVAVQTCDDAEVVTSEPQDSDPPEPVDHRAPPAVAIREEEVRLPQFKSGKGVSHRNVAPRSLKRRDPDFNRSRTKVRFS